MATHTTSPTTTITAGQISIYGHPSPTNSSTNTPSNSSPTSPRMSNAIPQQLPLQSRQIRPPKAPLYVPAVLRPTERPQKASPITPPRSVHGSLDSLNSDEAAAAPVRRQLSVDTTRSRVSKLAENAWMRGEHLGEVTGAPKRDHWKADSASQTCDSPTCRSFFGLFVRRHHCRHCGHVYCSSHTPFMVPLDQEARFHPEGTPSRVCDQCYTAYQRWEETRTVGMTRIQGLLNARKAGVISNNEFKAGMTAADEESDGSETPREAHQPEPVASSVPRDWNWSTF